MILRHQVLLLHAPALIYRSNTVDGGRTIDGQVTKASVGEAMSCKEELAKISLVLERHIDCLLPRKRLTQRNYHLMVMSSNCIFELKAY